MKNLLGILLMSLGLTACEQSRLRADASPDPGAKLFVDNCARCHQVTGAGGPAPGGLPAADIRKKTKSPAELREIITFGFGKMPSFKDSITDEQIAQIADYVATQIEYNTTRH